jgi:1,4-alpha-glucan branching enzyme
MEGEDASLSQATCPASLTDDGNDAEDATSDVGEEPDAEMAPLSAMTPSQEDLSKAQDWASAKVAALEDEQPSTKLAAAKAVPVVPVLVQAKMRHDVSRLTSDDIDLFNQGKHFRLYEKLGSHVMTVEGVEGTYFAVWAPNAQKVLVSGSFNNWNRTDFPLRLHGPSGIWEGFIEGVGKGTIYKYYIHSRYGGYRVEKADPFAHYAEIPPKSASIVWDMTYDWQDSQWLKQRAACNKRDSPIAIYEVHLGSWLQKHDEEEDRFLSYRELAPLLAEYVEDMGFTHVEFMPVMEHPFYGSWGYQCTGYFAASSRFGTPQDFMYLVDYLHQRKIGVLLDWVPSHFAVDMHGLSFFDGTHLYEHASPQKGWHPDWNSFIFNHGRYEVRSFLISSALFWLDWYHTDGLRVDAVASMLYLDYSRNDGEWIPNKYGGKENLEAIEFIQMFNEEVYRRFPDVQTVAEESTSWGSVSRPTYAGGLGFGMKWDMGWMHDTLFYMQRDAIHRKYHHDQLTFRMMYAYTENFVLPLSHDEVVHGKGSLLTKMSGEDTHKFANLRAMLCYMYSMPAKKLLFMGAEIAQWHEWSHEESVHWHITKHAPHSGVQQLVKDLNRLYRQEPCLHELDCEPGGFEWIDCNDSENSVLSFLRTCRLTNDIMLVVCNFTPVPRTSYHIGVPRGGYWRELLNSDAEYYWGSNMGNAGGVTAKKEPHHGRPYSIYVTLPPLGVIFLRSKGAW